MCGFLCFHSQAFLSTFSIETTSGSEMLLETLTAYIEKLNSGKDVNVEHTILLIILLRIFIKGLQPPDSFVKGKSSKAFNCNTETTLKNSSCNLLVVVCCSFF